MWVVLVLLPAAGAAVAAAAWRCRSALRELRRAERLAAGREFDLDRIELAFLAGVLAELMLVEMYEGGRLVASRSGDVTVTEAAAGAADGPGAGHGPGAGDGFEAVAVRWLGPTRTGDIGELIREVDRSPETKALRKRLAAQGLADDEELVKRAREAGERMPAVLVSVAAAGLAALVWTLARHENWLVPLTAFPPLFAAALWINHTSWPPTRSATGLGARVLAAALTSERWKHGRAAVAVRGLAALPEDHDLRICRAAARA
ncbi:hypothetical protein ACFU7Y_23560, partial [Kitasatospora sp. NPDC057542]